jgi:hypothetical protein
VRDLRAREVLKARAGLAFKCDLERDVKRYWKIFADNLKKAGWSVG